MGVTSYHLALSKAFVSSSALIHTRRNKTGSAHSAGTFPRIPELFCRYSTFIFLSFSDNLTLQKCRYNRRVDLQHSSGPRLCVICFLLFINNILFFLAIACGLLSRTLLPHTAGSAGPVTTIPSAGGVRSRRNSGCQSSSSRSVRKPGPGRAVGTLPSQRAPQLLLRDDTEGRRGGPAYCGEPRGDGGGGRWEGTRPAPCAGRGVRVPPSSQ